MLGVRRFPLSAMHPEPRCYVQPEPLHLLDRKKHPHMTSASYAYVGNATHTGKFQFSESPSALPNACSSGLVFGNSLVQIVEYVAGEGLPRTFGQLGIRVTKSHKSEKSVS